MNSNDSHFKITLATEPTIDSLFQEWMELVKYLPNKSFIHQPQWFASYLEAYPEKKTNTYIVTQYNNNSLCAVFPLQYINTSYLGISLKTWQIFWPGDAGINDFITSPPQNNTQKSILKNLIDFLNVNTQQLPWHVLELQNLPENSSVSNNLKLLQLSRHINYYNHDSKFISCKANLDETLAKVSSKFKRNNRRKLRKLEKQGSIHYEMANTETDLKKAFIHFVDVEAANWKGASQSALKYNSKQLTFYRLLINSFSKTKQCYIHSLWLNDKPIAVQFALAINDTFHLLKIGYNAEHQNISPGNILLNETIRRFSGDKKIKKINFVTGLKWNDDWAPHMIAVHHHKIFNKNFKGSIIFSLKRIKNFLREIKRNYVK